MRQSLRSGWLVAVLLSGVLSGLAQSQETGPAAVRRIAAGSVDISDLRPTSGVHTRRPAPSGPKLLEVESGVELEPIETSRTARPASKTAGRPAPKTRVVEIPTSKTPSKATPQKTLPEKALPETEETELPSEEAGSDVGPMAEGSVELNRHILALRDRLRKTLDYYYHRKLNTRENTHWEVMHQIVAYGVKAEVRKNSARGEPVNAISWLCWNQQCFGEKMLYTLGGLPAARQGPRVQGHEGQFLKMLAMSGVSPDYPMLVDGKRYTVADLIEQEKLTCKSKMELTFKLISLSYYLEDLDEVWRGRDGQEWSIERLIREELTQPILRDAACGGTHRLMGFSMALRQRRRAGGAIDGEYERAEKYINDYVKYTLSLQNSDGSFSTEWFRRREADPSLDRRLQTSGHILEWMVFTAPDEMLLDERIVRAVGYVARILDEGRSRQWEIGPLGHALHALSIYERRISYLESSGSEDMPETEPAPKAPEKKPSEKKTIEKKVTEPKGAEKAPVKTEPLKTEPLETEPSLEAPAKKVPEKKATEPKGTEPKGLDKKATEQEPEVKAPAKKTAKGPIKLPADAQRIDEVDVGAATPKAAVKKPAEKKLGELLEKKPAEPKLEQPKTLPKREVKATPKKAAEQAPVAEQPKADKPADAKPAQPQGESPKVEEAKPAQPKAEEQPKTEEPTPAEEPKPAEQPQAAEEPKPAAKPESEPALPESEPKLPGAGEPTPADPAEAPAEDKQEQKKPAAEKALETGDQQPAGKSDEKQPAAEKTAEPGEEPPAVKSDEKQAEAGVSADESGKIIKSAPVEQAEPVKKAEEKPKTNDEPTKADRAADEVKTNDAPAVQSPAAEKPTAEKPADEKPAEDKSREKAPVAEPAEGQADKFREPKFDLDPLAEPTGDDARRAPRNLENLDDLSRAGRLPPVDGAEDIRPAAPARRRTTAPDLWESPVFDQHRELADDVAAGEPRILPEPPVEAIDSPSQPVARVAGRTLRSGRQPDSEGMFPKILKRRLGILFVPKSTVPAR